MSVSNFKDAESWSEYVQTISGRKNAVGFNGIAVLFTSDTCGLCATAEEDFKSMADDYPSIFFLRLEMNRPGRSSQMMAPGTTMGKEIRGTPTVFVFSNKKDIGSVVGAGEKENIVELINQVLVATSASDLV